jgi:hypothetical protein
MGTRSPTGGSASEWMLFAGQNEPSGLRCHIRQTIRERFTGLAAGHPSTPRSRRPRASPRGYT